jgi:hypothetical protein
VFARSTQANTRVERGIQLDILESSAKIYAILGKEGAFAVEIDATANNIPSTKCRTIGSSIIRTMIASAVVGMKAITVRIPT